MSARGTSDDAGSAGRRGGGLLQFPDVGEGSVGAGLRAGRGAPARGEVAGYRGRHGYRRPVAKAYAAFFRNTNLGRPGSPSRAQLESAFLTAGASAVANVRTNGTVAFDAPDPAAARRVLDAAAVELRAVCGLTEPACVRSLADLRALPWVTVFAGIDPESVHELTVSFACSAEPPPLDLPLSSPRGDAVVVWCEGADVLSVTRQVMAGPGSPNALLERVTKTPFTSRALGTILHILAKHG